MSIGRGPHFLIVASIAMSAIVLAHFVDWWVLEHLAAPRFQETDLGRMFRVLGFIPLWICVALATVLGDDLTRSMSARIHRGSIVLVSAMLGGIVAEVLKVLVRRERPSANVDHYVFKSWSDDVFHSGGLGLPSSHVLVAFA